VAEGKRTGEKIEDTERKRKEERKKGKGNRGEGNRASTNYRVCRAWCSSVDKLMRNRYSPIAIFARTSYRLTITSYFSSPSAKPPSRPCICKRRDICIQALTVTLTHARTRMHTQLLGAVSSTFGFKYNLSARLLNAAAAYERMQCIRGFSVILCNLPLTSTIMTFLSVCLKTRSHLYRLLPQERI